MNLKYRIQQEQEASKVHVDDLNKGPASAFDHPANPALATPEVAQSQMSTKQYPLDSQGAVDHFESHGLKVDKEHHPETGKLTGASVTVDHSNPSHNDAFAQHQTVQFRPQGSYDDFKDSAPNAEGVKPMAGTDRSPHHGGPNTEGGGVANTPLMREAYNTGKFKQ